MFSTCLPCCGCHGNGRRHWKFCSYGRLEAEHVNQFWWNLVRNSKLGPQWQSCDQILKFLKFKMADGRHVRKYSKCHNSPTNWPTATQLGWSHLIMFSTCPPCCGCHGNGRWLAMAHWTFCSSGHLEAERVNQFCWNLVRNSKLGSQWQSHDQILKFLKFKTWTAAKLENIRNAIIRLPMDQLGRDLGGSMPSCSRHVRHVALCLEAERVNQFSWNLVQNSKLGP